METTVKVCEQSQELIAVLKKFNEAYDMFYAYMDKQYGKDRGTEFSFEEDFYNRWCDVTSIVDDCLCKAMIWELRESKFESI